MLSEFLRYFIVLKGVPKPIRFQGFSILKGDLPNNGLKFYKRILFFKISEMIGNSDR